MSDLDFQRKRAIARMQEQQFDQEKSESVKKSKGSDGRVYEIKESSPVEFHKLKQEKKS